PRVATSMGNFANMSGGADLARTVCPVALASGQKHIRQGRSLCVLSGQASSCLVPLSCGLNAEDDHRQRSRDHAQPGLRQRAPSPMTVRRAYTPPGANWFRPPGPERRRALRQRSERRLGYVCARTASAPFIRDTGTNFRTITRIPLIPGDDLAEGGVVTN